ncbi:MAG: amidohydrolase family protein [Acidobacteria bacterium]|nr:amidohydrolase family protein [Acidobacteriota bacterium]MBP7474141.1 amidohydrolase family protein [Pyrinomonadaceae bacterium]MBP9108529.1 amidohydrolase family protein [Pyrinomonadaceae bacterium]
MRSKLFLPLVAAICLSISASANAQSYAITNAKIVTVSGTTIEKGTVIVRNGLIFAVGANIRTPADATVLDAGGATVYPGFIDTVTNLGIVAPQAGPGGGPGGGGGGGQAAAAAAAAAAQPSSNSNYPAGLRPELMIEEVLRGGDAQFEASRNAGFTSALSTGRTGIFSGQSAVINLAGDSVSSLVIRSPFAQHISFVTLGGGGYPGSLLGTFSALRQIFNDARRLQENQRAYAADPKGMQRPGADKSLEALFPALNRQMPVVFSANSEIEIIRALDFMKEYNLNGIIAGGLEAGRVADRLKAQSVPVLLSLNFPKRLTASSPDADPEPLAVLRSRAEVPKGAAKLSAAGVKFAFQSGGATAMTDYFANAGKAIENGLSRDAAIRAMTLGAAEILGVDKTLGSIEAGKVANLVVIKGDLFGRDKFASHVFVDGRHFEQKEPVRPAGGRGPGGQGGGPGATPPTPAGPSMGGTYTITIDVPGQPIQATLNLAQAGTTMTGTMVSQLGSSQITNGRATANGFSFTTSVQFGGASIDISVTATVSGNQVSGTVDSPQGPVQFSGTKNP